MGAPVAKKGDQVIGLDTHIVLVPSPGGPVPTPLPHPFTGIIDDQVSETVFIDDQGAAVVGSVAHAIPPHIPMGGPFQTPPANRATIDRGSESIFVDDVAVARAGDPAKCCNDPMEQVTGSVVAVGDVFAD
jgi:uncharacterized Zn-binding protein involved in type VI secretion